MSYQRFPNEPDQKIAAALHLPVCAVIPEEDAFFLDNIAERSRAFRRLADSVLGMPSVGRETVKFGRKRG